MSDRESKANKGPNCQQVIVVNGKDIALSWFPSPNLICALRVMTLEGLSKDLKTLIFSLNKDKRDPRGSRVTPSRPFWLLRLNRNIPLINYLSKQS